MFKFTRSFLIIAAVAGAVWALAWVEDRPPEARFGPEQSQAQLEAQQGLQRVQGEVGSVPRRKGDTRLDGPATDADAADNLASVPIAGDDEDAKAKAVLSTAGRTGRSGPPPRTPWWWGLVALGAVGGAFAGFRWWADRFVPEAPKVKPVRW